MPPNSDNSQPSPVGHRWLSEDHPEYVREFSSLNTCVNCRVPRVSPGNNAWSRLNEMVVERPCAGSVEARSALEQTLKGEVSA